MRGIQLVVAVCAAFSVMAAPSIVLSQDNGDAVHAPFVTHHSGHFGRTMLHYTATAGWTNVPGPDGSSWAQAFSVAYTEDRASPRRPVVFIFNGGPGASSAFLHLAVLGPRHVVFPSDLHAAPATPEIDDNPSSPLSIADLVFIDPPETGYSRTLPADKAHDFASIEGDARIVGSFIRTWLASNGRESSPKFVLGESYGATRASLIADQLADPAAKPAPIRLNGIALLSQFLTVDDLGQRPMNAQGYATYLPTIAAVAWYHGKVDHAGRTYDSFEADVRKFAFEEYLPALMQGDELSSDSRAAIAAKLSSFTGIDAKFLEDHDLKLTVTQFRHTLMPGQILGDYDGRYSAPNTSAASEPTSAITEDPANDPSWITLTKTVDAAVGPYFQSELKIRVDGDYVFTNNKLGPVWNFGTKFRKPATAWLTEALARNDGMHLFLASGRHDLLAPFAGTRYLMSELDLTKNRGELHVYDGGHMFYTDPDSFGPFLGDLKAFIIAGAKPYG